MEVTAYQIAHNFIGVKEVQGAVHNPLVVAMHQVGTGLPWVKDDETPWCSSFVNFICFCLGIHRSKSPRARSWLNIGTRVEIKDATVGWDIVILKRGSGEQPGPEVLNAPGHVGFFAGFNQGKVYLLAGNQDDQVSIKAFPMNQILGIRRLSNQPVQCQYGNNR